MRVNGLVVCALNKKSVKVVIDCCVSIRPERPGAITVKHGGGTVRYSDLF